MEEREGGGGKGRQELGVMGDGDNDDLTVICRCCFTDAFVKRAF